MGIKVAAVAIVVLVAALVACVIYIVVGINDDTMKFALVAAILAVAGVFAVRLSVSFDLNRYLEAKREARRRYAKSLCPHMSIVSVVEGAGGDSGLEVRPTHESPPGTASWQCMLCGHVASKAIVDDNITRWSRDPEGLSDQLEKYRAAASEIDGHRTGPQRPSPWRRLRARIRR